MSKKFECNNCNLKKWLDEVPDGWFGLFVLGDIDNTPRHFCSTSCLIEYAWKLRERHPKLSKSRPR